jgi:hypothetical protein
MGVGILYMLVIDIGPDRSVTFLQPFPRGTPSTRRAESDFAIFVSPWHISAKYKTTVDSDFSVDDTSSMHQNSQSPYMVACV